jgi:hypothetical protein
MMMENTSSQITNISSSSQGFGYDMNAGCTKMKKMFPGWRKQTPLSMPFTPLSVILDVFKASDKKSIYEGFSKHFGI